jgi:hypothetical protein
VDELLETVYNALRRKRLSSRREKGVSFSKGLPFSEGIPSEKSLDTVTK